VQQGRRRFFFKNCDNDKKEKSKKSDNDKTAKKATKRQTAN
jgi:hypothetical protein